MGIKKNKKLWLLDFGHSGVDINGNYATPGKQFHFDNGPSIYEGDINRAIGYKVIPLLHDLGINYRIITKGTKDISLSQRVKAINSYCKKFNNCAVISFHSNAGGGKGIEIFTYLGESESDKIAETFLKTYREKTIYKLRVDTTDGDLDKEANFKILRETHCPAILIENLFYDNKVEANYLLNHNHQRLIATTIAQAIYNYETGK